MATAKAFTGNAAATTLAAQLASGGTSFTVPTGQGSGYPTVQHVVTIDREGTAEMVLVTRSGDTFTVVGGASGRGYGGTVDVTHAAGVTVEHTIDPVLMAELLAHVTETTVSGSAVTKHTSAGLDTDSVTATQIAAGAVGTGEIADAAVTAAKIAAGAVGAGEIANGSVGVAELASAARYPLNWNADATTQDLQNSATVGTLVNFQIDGGLLATRDRLRLTVIGDVLYNANTAHTLTLLLKFGTTTVLSMTGLAFGSLSASRRAWTAAFDIFAETTNAQKVGGGIIFAAAAAAGVMALTSSELSGYGTAAEDTSTAKALRLDAQWSNASANNSFRVHAVMVEIVKFS